jgi:hypothetical protein
LCFCFVFLHLVYPICCQFLWIVLFLLPLRNTLWLLSYNMTELTILYGYYHTSSISHRTTFWTDGFFRTSLTTPPSPPPTTKTYNDKTNSKTKKSHRFLVCIYLLKQDFGEPIPGLYLNSIESQMWIPMVCRIVNINT